MEERNLRKERVGVVVSNKMEKTITVNVDRKIKHAVYGKFMNRSKKFAAHDENNTSRVGDKVLIIQARPISKTKKWRVSKILEKAV